MSDWTIVNETPLPPRPPADGAPPSAPSWEIVGEQPLKDISGKLIEKGRDILSQEEQDIDYKTGASASTRILFQRSSNPTEDALVLNKLYGRNNYGQDRFGQWWVREGDKRVAVLPKGLIGGIKTALTGLGSSPGATAGTIAGGLLGEMAFPAGGGIPGAMVGGAAGKGLDELMKWASGLFAQKPAEVVGSMATEGAVAGLFQGAGPLARKAGQPIRSMFQSVAGTKSTQVPIPGAPLEPSRLAPVRRGLDYIGAPRIIANRFSEGSYPTRTVPQPSAQMGRDLAAGGAIPPIGSYAPGATSLEAKRSLRDMIVGPPTKAETANILYLNTRMRQILTNEGLTPAEVNSMITEIQNTSSRQSTQEAGAQIVGRAQAVNRDLLNDHADIRAGVERDLLTNTDKLRKYAEKAPVTLGQQLSDAIIGQRRDFSRRMGNLYQTIDRLTGDQEVVPVAGIQQAANEVIQVMPPQAVPPIIRQMADGSLWAQQERDSPITHINFERAHALRSTLREIGEVIDVAPNPIATRNVRRLAGAVNTAINSSGDQLTTQVAGFLQRADKLYADGIARYNNLQINRIVRDMRSGIIPEPGTVVRLFMKPDNIHLARTVLDMLPDKVRQNVIRADLGNMLEQASTRNAEGRQVLDGESFLKIIDSRMKLLNETYPIGRTMELRRHALNLAAFDGRIDVTGVTRPTDIMNRLEQGVAALRAADEFAKTNPIGAFVNGTPAQIDRALARITQPGNEAMTDHAAATLDINSNAWWAVRKYALQRLLSSATTQRPSLLKTVSGNPIDQTLQRLTARQQELLFPSGLADDLRLLAKEARFLFPKDPFDLYQQQAAGAIKQGLWLNPIALTKYITKNIAGYIADHPRLLQYLAGEVRRDPVRARGIMSQLGQHLATRAALSGPGKGKLPPGQDVEPKQPVVKAPEHVPQYGGTD